MWWAIHCTLRSQIEGYTRLLIFRKFSILPAVIWASPFINFQENFQPPCFFTYTNEIFSTLPAVIRAYPLIKFEEKFQPTLLVLLEPPLVLETYEYVNKQILMMERKVQPLNITLSLSNTKYERPYEHGLSGLIFILKLDTRLMIYLDFGRI